MKDHKNNRISRIRVRDVLKDAEIIEKQYRTMTRPFKQASETIQQIVEEILAIADLDERVGNSSARLQDQVYTLISIMDGDLTPPALNRLAPSQSIAESTSNYEVSWNESGRSHPSVPFHQQTLDQDVNTPSTQKKKRNPPWTRPEIILATEVYIENDGRVLGPNDEPVIELSEFLNSLPIIPVDARNEKFRNPEGVGLKLSNIRAADPERPGGSPHGNQLDGLFWDELAGDENLLYAEARRIRERYSK